MDDEMRDDGHLPATKADLRALATKADLRAFATQADLRELTLRLDDHDRRFDGIDGNLRRLNFGFARMEGDMTEVKNRLDTLSGHFAAYSTLFERMSNNIENALRKMDLQGSMLMVHEGRIVKLESRPS